MNLQPFQDAGLIVNWSHGLKLAKLDQNSPNLTTTSTVQIVYIDGQKKWVYAEFTGAMDKAAFEAAKEFVNKLRT